VLVVWECQLAPKRRQRTLHALDLALSKIVLDANAPRRYGDGAVEQLPIAAEPAAPPYGHAVSKK